MSFVFGPGALVRGVAALDLLPFYAAPVPPGRPY